MSILVASVRHIRLLPNQEKEYARELVQISDRLLWRVKLNQRPITASMVLRWQKTKCQVVFLRANTRPTATSSSATPSACQSHTHVSSPHAESQCNSELNRDLMRNAFPLYCGVRDLPQPRMIGLGVPSRRLIQSFGSRDLTSMSNNRGGVLALLATVLINPLHGHVPTPLYPLLVHRYVRLNGLYY